MPTTFGTGLQAVEDGSCSARVELAQRRAELGHPGLVLTQVAEHALHAEQGARVGLAHVSQSPQLFGASVRARLSYSLFRDL